MTIARKTVMISSTARDLPKHREEVMNACLSQGMFPVMMEHLPANDDDAISASLKMVDEADIYVGIYAQRYGYIPKGKKRNPKQISITEMEYNHAIKRKIPCLLFVMHKEHPITIDDIDLENASKLQKFKGRIETKVVNFFKSPAELRAQVINSLSKQIESAPVTHPDIEVSTIDATAYFNALRKRYNVLALEGLTPPQKEEYLQIQLRSVFVEQSVREDTPPVELPKEVWEKLSREQEIHSEDLPSGITLDDVRKARDSYYQKPSQLVLDALTDTKNKYSIILGDPGSGKSTLSRYVMLSLIDPLLADDKIQKVFEGYLPLLIELRTFAGLSDDGKCETPLEFLEHLGKTEGWGLTQSALHNYLKDDGRAVVIFDGLDEIFEPKLRETITNQIVGFTNAYPKARVIVTSRILGYRRKILSDAGFIHYTLQDLDEKQVKAFITKWYELAMSERPEEARERSERILKSFADQASIRQLAGNPMLLTIMAIIGKHQELPRERWKLYDHAASVLIQHWDVNKHLKDERIEADFIGEDDKKELLRRLAFRMQSGDGGLAGNYIHREDLQDEFENYLKERYSQTPDRAKMIAEAMIQQFRERNFILSLYGANVFGFVHRAFLEYFCASAFVWKFEKTKELTIEQLKTDVYGKHWNDQNWHEVLRLICGMIDERWAGDLIQHLVTVINKPYTILDLEQPPWNLALAVQCMGELKNLVYTFDAARKLLREIFNLLEKNMLSLNYAVPPNFPTEQIIPYVKSIGKNWPHRTDLVELLQPKGRENFRWGVASTHIDLGEFVGAIGQESSDIYNKVKSLLSDRNEDYRAMILVALANGWSSEVETFKLIKQFTISDTYEIVRMSGIFLLANTFHDHFEAMPFLQEIALNDKDTEVRSSAVDALAQNFKDDRQTLPFLHNLALNDKDGSVRSSAVRSLGQYFKDDGQTLSLLRGIALNKKDAVRSSAVRSLAQYFKDDGQTLPLLRDHALNDKEAEVRSSAVRSLAQYFKDDGQTLSLLRDCALNDKDGNVRSSAVRSLAQYFKDDGQTLPLLRDLALNDKEAEVRSSAVRSLVQYFKDDGQTLPLLRDLALNDKDGSVRSSAVRSLAQYFKDDGQTLPLLRDLALNDKEAEVRSSAGDALGEYFKDDGRTLPLLRDLALNDKNGNVRSSAVRSLAQYFNDDGQTLPLLRDIALNDKEAEVRSSAGDALGEYFKDDGQTLSLLRDLALNDKEAEVRSSAVRSLAQYFNDDGRTLPLLRGLALNDKDGSVRSSAVRSLVQYFKDDGQTLPLLRDLALNDKDGSVRSSAGDALGEYFKDDGQTLPLLRDHALNDKEAEVRSSAVSSLVQYFKDDGQTLLLLRDLALNDKEAEVRSSAGDALGEYFKDDGQTLPLLRDLALNDKEAEVRSSAVSSLAQYFKDDGQTLPLLRDLALNDKEAEVRSSAVRSLVQYFKDDRQTLPLLFERATQEVSPTAEDPNDNYYPREAALESIAEKWADHPDTLLLLSERAKNDPTPWLRERCRELINEIKRNKDN